MQDVIVESGADNSGIARGMAQMRGIIAQNEAAIRGSFAGMFSVGVVTAFVGQIIRTADRVQDLAERFRVSSTFLQQWGLAGEKAGTSMEGLASGMQKLIVNVAKANDGDETLLKHFRELGISADDLRRRSPEEIFAQIARGTKEADDMVAIFGRNALELVPVMEGVANGSIKLGDAMQESTIKTLAEVHDMFTQLKQDLTITGGEALGGFVKAWQQGWNSIIASAMAGKEVINGLLIALAALRKGDISGARDALINAGLGASGQIQAGIEGNSSIVSPAAPSANRPLPGGAASTGPTGTSAAAAASRVARVESSTWQSVADGWDKIWQKVNSYAEKALLAAAQEKARREESLRLARQQTDVLRAELSGNKALAEELEKQHEWENAILLARRDGNEGLARELETQQGITEELREQVEIAREAAALEVERQAYRQRWREGLQSFANNAGTWDWSQFQQDPTLTALQRLYGPKFGTSGAGGGPSMSEQATIRAYQREQDMLAANLTAQGFLQGASGPGSVGIPIPRGVPGSIFIGTGGGLETRGETRGELDRYLERANLLLERIQENTREGVLG